MRTPVMALSSSVEVAVLPEVEKGPMGLQPHDFDEIMKTIRTLDNLRTSAEFLNNRKLPDRAMLKLAQVQILVNETLMEFVEATTKLH